MYVIPWRLKIQRAEQSTSVVYSEINLVTGHVPEGEFRNKPGMALYALSDSTNGVPDIQYRHSPGKRVFLSSP